jgi:hypothetical protein
MALSAAHSVAKQTEAGLRPRTCPVCGGALRTAGTRRWTCEHGHSVAHHPECADTAHREGLGGDGNESNALVPRPTREDIAVAKAEWERKLKRERQRRWRARKRAGLV